MSLEVFAKTDKGLKRETNQDSYLVNKELGLFVIADGMGGHSGGEIASSMAVKEVEKVIKEEGQTKALREILTKAYEEASQRIFDKASYDSPELAGMGTTMVLFWVRGGRIYIANVGDSRAYLFIKPHLWQLTEDHSLVNEQLRAGLIREDQVKNFSGRNVITRSVGYEREVVVDIVERKLAPGEQYLLCSDGLSSLVTDEIISQVMCESSGEETVNRLVEAALKNGGDDNVTVLLLKN